MSRPKAHPLELPVRSHWLVWTLFLVCVSLTLFASLRVKQRIENEAIERVGFAYDQATLKIEERLTTYAQILRGAAALFVVSDEITRAQWQGYVEKLHTEESVPGVQGIGFAQVIPPGRLDAHVQRIRKEGFPNYTVRPSGERDVTTAIIYLEPFRDRNLRAFGYDMFSEPVRRAAMELARDSGTAALSGKVELVQETAKDVQAGTLMYVPVYHHGAALDTVAQKSAALIGWAYSPYRMNDLMSGILRDWVNEEGLAIDLHIYDGSAVTPANLLYDSKPANELNASSLFYQQRQIDFNGRQWLLVFDYRVTATSLNYAVAWLVLIGGLVVSALLLGLMLAVINTQTNAKRIAGELVAKIVDREAALKKQADVLIRANAELTRLGEVMAHHFQEPTRRMASFAQRLLNRPALLQDIDSHQSLTFINQQAHYLSELVRDAQRYLDIDPTKVSRDGTADSGAVLRQIIADAGTATWGTDITVREPVPRVRLGEPFLGELFAILLDNALRYRHPDRALRVEVSAAVAGDRAVFRFADNGSGIAPEYRVQVFELFARLVPSSVPGTGMGLAMVRKIVQQSGGDVRIEDGIEGGTAIVFDLPVETRS